MPKAEFEALIEEIIDGFSIVKHTLNSKVARILDLSLKAG